MAARRPGGAPRGGPARGALSAPRAPPGAPPAPRRFPAPPAPPVPPRRGAPAAAPRPPEAPVEVCLGGGGFFPHERRPRVAWLGGSAPGMERWAAAIEGCATALGIDPEPRPFSLHVTLARLDRPWGAGDVETFVTAVGKWRLAPFVAR